MKLTGECVVFELPLEGTIAGGLQVPTEKPVEVGNEPAAAKTLQAHFSWGAPLTKVWLETSGSLKEDKFEFDTYGGRTEPNGTLELELAGGSTWGVFT